MGGSLYLSNLTSIPEGFNPTVGGSLYLRNGLKCNTKKPDILFSWKNGKYILVDGIFTEVKSKYGNLYSIIEIGHRKKEMYLYGKGKYFAHGETAEKAKEDYTFKKLSEKLKHDPIKQNTQIDIRYYRLITGACEAGVRKWMQQNNISKEKIKASELLPILRKTNAYGLERFEKLVTF